MNARALVISLHDVSPYTHAECTRVFSWSSRQSEFHIARSWSSPIIIAAVIFSADVAWCDWLREQAGRGHEIVAHGYYHQRAVQPAKRCWIAG
jgi:predicted deacetylase